jgi:hypothetical protein
MKLSVNKQLQGRKILGRESEIRRISPYKKREQDNEGEDKGSSEEWYSSGNPKKISKKKVTPIRTLAKLIRMLSTSRIQFPKHLFISNGYPIVFIPE